MEKHTSDNNHKIKLITPVIEFMSQLMGLDKGLGAAVKGIDRRYVQINAAMLDLIGRDSDTCIGATDEELFNATVASHLRELDERIINESRVTTESIDISAGGDPLHVQWIGFPILNSDESVEAVGVLMFDLSRNASYEEMRSSIVELNQMVRKDKLTGVWNRVRLEEVIANEMERMTRFRHPLSMLMVDIDLFKEINDTYGHSEGDVVLKGVAQTIGAALRKTDLLARWGGDEFVVLCPNSTLETTMFLAERLRRNISASVRYGDKPVTVSVGVSEAAPDEIWEQWFVRTDSALYRAKNGGRNQVQIAPEKPEYHVGTKKVVLDVLKLVWDERIESGNTTVDRIHMLAFKQVNTIIEAVISECQKSELVQLCDDFIRDVAKSFSDEERLLKKSSYPEIKKHIDGHRKMIRLSRNALLDFSDDRIEISVLCKLFIKELVVGHMLDEDRKYFSYIPSIRQQLTQNTEHA